MRSRDGGAGRCHPSGCGPRPKRYSFSTCGGIARAIYADNLPVTADEHDQSINMLLGVALEAQTWAAALKEILFAKGITTDEEFAK